MDLMQRMFGRICMAEEDGGMSGGSGGDSGSTSGSESTETSTESSTATSSESDAGEPKTMLEAIEASLEKKEDPPANGDPKAEKKNADAKGQPKPMQKDGQQQPQQGEEEMHKMPEGLSPRAQERFRNLSEKVKETSQHLVSVSEALQKTQEQLNEANSVRESFRSFYTSTGTNPQQMNEVAAYLKATNSGDIETEVNILLSRLRDIQMETGRPIDGLNEMADPLQQFPDLMQAVNGYQMTRETAMELARSRTMQQSMQHEQQTTNQRQAEVRGWNQGKDSAVNSLKAWEQNIAATDPDYAALAPLVMGNQEAMKHIIENYPPSSWQTHVVMLYNQAKAAAKKFRQPQGESPRPLSGVGAKPTGATPKAGSMFEAMFPNG